MWGEGYDIDAETKAGTKRACVDSKREARNKRVWLLAQDARNKRRGVFLGAIEVGADWYCPVTHGGMVRFIHRSTLPAGASVFGLTGDHILASILREYGRRASAAEAAAAFPEAPEEHDATDEHDMYDMEQLLGD